MMKVVLLLSIVVVCVCPCLCRSTECDKVVLDAITQLRIRLDELVLAQSQILDLHYNRTRYEKITSSLLHKYRKLQKYKRRQKHGSHRGKMNNGGEKKVFISVETPSTPESTTIDYTTETMEMIVSTDTENLTTEMSGGFTDNPTTLSNLR